MRQKAKYGVFKKKVKDRLTGKVINRYCARFYDPDTGNVIKTTTLLVSEGEDKGEYVTSKGVAVAEAAKLLGTADAKQTDNPLIIDFLKDHWAIEATGIKKYREETRSYRYLKIAQTYIKKWEIELKGVKLRSVTLNLIERIATKWADAGISGRTINGAVAVIRIPLRAWSRKNHVENPLQYWEIVKENTRKRGTLSIDEIKKICALKNPSPKVLCATLLGALCGLRLGEVRGLQVSDIDREKMLIHIRHNWVCKEEGLKAPKCSTEKMPRYRDVPLPKAVLDSIDLLLKIPHKKSSYVIFNNVHPDMPCSDSISTKGFHKLLEDIGINEKEREERHLVFHGLRHTFVTLSRLTLPDFVVMSLAGHKSLTMTDSYTNVDDKVIDFDKARKKMNSTLAKAGNA
jgi:integrase